MYVDSVHYTPERDQVHDTYLRNDNIILLTLFILLLFPRMFVEIYKELLSVYNRTLHSVQIYYNTYSTICRVLNILYRELLIILKNKTIYPQCSVGSRILIDYNHITNYDDYKLNIFLLRKNEQLLKSIFSTYNKI